MVSIANPSDKKLEGVSLYKPMGINSGLHVLLKNGDSKSISALQIGDEILLGGKITNVIHDQSQDIYVYKGLEVTGSMKVLMNGRWVRVEQVENAKRLTNSEPINITIIQSEIHLFATPDNIVFSSNLNDVCVELNEKHKLNAMLSEHFQCYK